MSGRIAFVVSAMALVACALALVTAQQQARNAFIDLERARGQHRQLLAQGDRLRIELERLAQPSAIEAAARRMGLRALDPARTVLLPVRVEGGGAKASDQDVGEVKQ